MQIPDPQIPKRARPLSPAEREDSIPKRQRPAEVNTVPTIEGSFSGNEIATLTDDQNALHTAKVNAFLNICSSRLCVLIHAHGPLRLVLRGAQRLAVLCLPAVPSRSLGGARSCLNVPRVFQRQPDET